MTLFDFSKEIQDLVKVKKFKEALNYFKENKTQFAQEQISGNAYLISAMLSALRHEKKINDALRFLEIYHIIIDENTKESIITQYGWLLYDKYKTENILLGIHEVEAEFFDEEDLSEIHESVHSEKSATVKMIENLVPIILKYDNKYTYSILSALFNIIPKSEKKKANANWQLINDLCELIPADRLKTDCESREVERKGKMVMMEFASDRENWYAYKTKALYKLGKFQECCDISNQALESFQKFHYSNDIWFARRIALSKKKLGNSENAIDELLQILMKKHEWFIEKELAELYKEKGDAENAFKYAILAINNFGDLEYKVDLLFLLGELLKEKQEPDLSFKHFSLASLIRQSEEWNIPQKLNSALDEFGKTNISIEELQALKNDLKKYWNGFKPERPAGGEKRTELSPKLSGKIQRILHNDEKGADGFIKYGENQTVYFRVNPTDLLIESLAPGVEVEFKIQPAKEDKKERAIQVKRK